MIKINKLKAVKPKRVGKNNMAIGDLKIDQIYLILGEVHNINHYILLEYSTGKIMPGMYHLDDVEDIDIEKDL